jgi:hypothetical protein
MSELDYESDEGGGFGFGNKASDDEFESSWDGGNGEVDEVVELEESVEEVRVCAPVCVCVCFYGFRGGWWGDRAGCGRGI